MSTVVEQDGISLIIHSGREERHHLPHVHVKGRGCEIVISLVDFAALTHTKFHSNDLRKIQKMVKFYQEELMEVWNAYHKKA